VPVPCSANQLDSHVFTIARASFSYRPSATNALWALVASAVAAGIVLAAVLFGPHRWRTGPRRVDVARAAEPVAQVTLTTGSVFTCPSQAPDEWRPVAPGAALTEGAGVRTAPSARCELRLADGSQVRLNEATEARLVGGPAVELKRGQVWSAVPQDS